MWVMNMSFKSYNLSEEMINALKKIGFHKPTKVQKMVMPLLLKDKKVIVQSETGSGKTHSFLVPILEKIDTTVPYPQAVIISPTRELAEQLYQVTVELSQKFNKDITVKRYIGGTDRNRSIEKSANQPHIVIGTPGRIVDLFSDNSVIRLDKSSMIVFDEADMTFDGGFLKDIDSIISKMAEDVQIMVFSATIPENMRPFLIKYMEDVKVIDLSQKDIGSKNVEHVLIRTRGASKEETLLELLTIIQPFLALVFANKKTRVDELYGLLTSKNYETGLLHGDLEPRARKRAIKQINDLKYHYVCASDIAARGIDITGVSHVVSIDIPNNLEYYIHRAGRTGRFDQTGISYIIYDKDDIPLIEKLESKNIKFKHVEIKKGDFAELGDFKARGKREFKTNENYELAKLKVKANKKKVKPGYKKKFNQKVNREMSKINRRNNRKK
jgi:ATP-dependent RNA helicase CshB